MAANKHALGKGLDSLIANKVGTAPLAENKKSEEKPAEVKVKISKVEPNREQPRKNFDEDALLELAAQSWAATRRFSCATRRSYVKEEVR